MTATKLAVYAFMSLFLSTGVYASVAPASFAHTTTKVKASIDTAVESTLDALSLGAHTTSDIQAETNSTVTEDEQLSGSSADNHLDLTTDTSLHLGVDVDSQSDTEAFIDAEVDEITDTVDEIVDLIDEQKIHITTNQIIDGDIDLGDSGIGIDTQTEGNIDVETSSVTNTVRDTKEQLEEIYDEIDTEITLGVESDAHTDTSLGEESDTIEGKIETTTDSVVDLGL